ncbi:hypothetical protein [Bacillus sp. OK048]|uniref:hypothetical protein n=1 Tax=Bacillus sp. OK048 TaxID=1882761 RepID=UPI000882EA6C|nr:hypothetical protein [Bacillus sp. OK048]SDL94952.1 hypothetical protein SAMN05443253_101258 [Bacillus sp. OK048]
MSLIEGFQKVNDDKFDHPDTKLKNIKFEGFNDNNQIILRFIKDNVALDDTVATGEYTFTHDFLNHFFQMGYFAKFCFKHNYHDLLSECITYLMEERKKEESQYRLIMKEDNYYIRGLTSTDYNNYDNHIAIYLILLALHAYAKKENIFFKILKANLTDSDIEIFIEQENPIHVSDIGKIYLGIYVSNNEVGKKAFSIDLNYKFMDNDGASFRAFSTNQVFKINHRTSIRNVEKQLENINNLEEMRKETLEQIHFMIKNPEVDDNTLYEMVYREIDRRTKTFSSDTRKKARVMYDETHINNTISIIKIFHQISQITDDEEEKLNLERIYHDVLIRMNKRKARSNNNQTT